MKTYTHCYNDNGLCEEDKCYCGREMFEGTMEAVDNLVEQAKRISERGRKIKGLQE